MSIGSWIMSRRTNPVERSGTNRPVKLVEEGENVWRVVYAD